MQHNTIEWRGKGGKPWRETLSEASSLNSLVSRTGETISITSCDDKDVSSGGLCYIQPRPRGDSRLIKFMDVEKPPTREAPAPSSRRHGRGRGGSEVNLFRGVREFIQSCVRRCQEKENPPHLKRSPHNVLRLMMAAGGNRAGGARR